MNNAHLHPEDLEGFAVQTFGSGYKPAGSVRLYGGAQKVIYDVAFTNGFRCLLYVWDMELNYFKTEIEEQGDDATGQSYGADLFALNHAFLTANGIPTPALYALNREKTRYPFEYAFVEFVDGPKLETVLSRPDAEERMAQFADVLKRMHGLASPYYGKPGSGKNEAADEASGEDGRGQVPCHRHQLANAVKQLDYAARHVDEAADHYERLLNTLHELESRIAPRRKYGFIHGELGPDHVLVREDAGICLIDIEGASFYDIEHEHGFLELRFGPHYKLLRDDSLDEARLDFYRLHHYVSLTAGGLKLLQRGFHDRALAQAIMEHNLRRALQFVGSR